MKNVMLGVLLGSVSLVGVVGCSAEPAEEREGSASNLTENGQLSQEEIDEVLAGVERDRAGAAGESCSCVPDGSNKTSRQFYLTERECESHVADDGREGGFGQGSREPIDISSVDASCSERRVRVFYVDPRMSYCTSTSIGVDCR